MIINRTLPDTRALTTDLHMSSAIKSGVKDFFYIFYNYPLLDYYNKLPAS